MASSTIGKAREWRDSLGGRIPARNAQQQLFVWMVLAPLILSFVLFWIYPAVRGFLGSFTQWRGFDPNAPYVGLQNYMRAFDDPIFRISLRNTFYYALLTVPTTVGLSLLLALAIEASGRLRGIFRMLYFLPVVTPVIATALVW